MSASPPALSGMNWPQAPAVPARAGLNLSGALALFGVTLRRLCLGPRLFLTVLAASAPCLILLVARAQGQAVDPGDFGQGVFFILMAQAIVPISALSLSSGLIQDEVEEQTLTYLLVRPIPRWAIYITKLLAATLVSCVVVTFFVLLTELALQWPNPDRWNLTLDRGVKIAGAFTLGLLAYNAVFALLGLIFKKPQGMGVLYIVVLEGFFANIDFIFRRATVIYYERVLMLRWLGLDGEEFSLNLADAPSNVECILTLLLVTVVVTLVGIVIFSMREFRVKTPEAT